MTQEPKCDSSSVSSERRVSVVVEVPHVPANGPHEHQPEWTDFSESEQQVILKAEAEQDGLQDAYDIDQVETSRMILRSAVKGCIL